MPWKTVPFRDLLRMLELEMLPHFGQAWSESIYSDKPTLHVRFLAGFEFATLPLAGRC